MENGGPGSQSGSRAWREHGRFCAAQGQLQRGAEVFPEHPIGVAGRQPPNNRVLAFEARDLGVLEETPPNGVKPGPRRRFWNCFGLGNPANQHTLQIVVEINPPHEGEDQRVAGLFACDEANRFYIAHTGKVGGGRPGIGANTFRDFFKNEPWSEIACLSGTRVALVFGPVDASHFPAQLADFVRKVATLRST